MNVAPKILSIQASSKFELSVQYENGISGKFCFLHFYEFIYPFDFLVDVKFFSSVKISSNQRFAYWVNPNGETIELDSEILYSIISGDKIYYNNVIVFDPSLGKGAWLR